MGHKTQGYLVFLYYMAITSETGFFHKLKSGFLTSHQMILITHGLIFHNSQSGHISEKKLQEELVFPFNQECPSPSYVTTVILKSVFVKAM